jgi:hypothetical protein
MQSRRYVPWTPLRLIVAAACLEALVAIGSHGPPAPTLETARPTLSGIPPARPSHWIVKVDGWTFGLDNVHRGYLRALDLAPATLEELVSLLDDGSIPYRDLIVRTAMAEGVDWRLVVAVIAIESGFDPTSESTAGAYGLMQVRPIAARDVEMAEFHTPAANIRAGVRYLRRLLTMFPAADPQHQVALALAAYNMGPAHLNDAQLLAERYGLNSRRWYDAVERVLPLLEHPGVYQKLPNGFAQGRQVLRYVERVLTQYEQLRRTYPREPDLGRQSVS